MAYGFFLQPGRKVTASSFENQVYFRGLLTVTVYLFRRPMIGWRLKVGNPVRHFNHPNLSRLLSYPFEAVCHLEIFFPLFW